MPLSAALSLPHTKLHFQLLFISEIMWKYPKYILVASTVCCVVCAVCVKYAFVFGCWKHESDVSHAHTQHATMQSGKRSTKYVDACVCEYFSDACFGDILID